MKNEGKVKQTCKGKGQQKFNSGNRIKKGSAEMYLYNYVMLKLQSGVLEVADSGIRLFV